MALSPDLQALNRYLRDQNVARVGRIAGVAVLKPELVVSPIAPGGFVPPKPWMRSAVAGRWCVRYRYHADHEFLRYTHRAETPADLVRFMRDGFRGNAYLDVLSVWEAAK